MIYVDLYQVGLFLWAALLVALVVWVFVDRLGRGWRGLGYRSRTWVLLGIVTATIVLGAIGYLVEASTGVSAAGTGGRDPSGAVAERNGMVAFVDAFLKSTQHLVMQIVPDGDENWLIVASRWAGFAAFVLFAYAAVELVFAESIQRFLLGYSNDHIVICGLGRIGSELIKDILDRDACRQRGWKRPPRIIVLESNPQNAFIAMARERGARVLIGDAADGELLRQVRAERARNVFFITGSDERNLEGASKLFQIIKDDNMPPSKPRSAAATPLIDPFGASPSADRSLVLVHLENPDLDFVLFLDYDKKFATNDEGYPDFAPMVRTFNALNFSIQTWFDQALLPRRPRTDDEVAHFIVVGFGEVGWRLTLWLGELAHFENGKRPRVTVVYQPEEEENVQTFKQLYPKFFPPYESADQRFDLDKKKARLSAKKYNPWQPWPALDDWSFGVRIADVENPRETDRGVYFAANGGFVMLPGGCGSKEFVDQVSKLAQTAGVRPFVLVCGARDEVNCTQSLELREELDNQLKIIEPSANGNARSKYLDSDHLVTIFPYVPRRPMLTASVSQSPLGVDLIPFGDCSLTCSYENLCMEVVRPLASAIARDFDLSEKKYSAKSFFNRPAFQRHSNMMAAVHVNAKLAVLGHQVKFQQNSFKRIQPVQVDAQLEKTIARMEHHRYLAERMLADWSFGKPPDKASMNGRPSQPENKKRFALVPWDKLKAADREKNNRQIRDILEFLQKQSHVVVVPMCTCPTPST